MISLVSVGYLQGMAEGVVNLFARPVKGGMLLVERVVEGAGASTGLTYNDNLSSHHASRLTKLHREHGTEIFTVPEESALSEMDENERVYEQALQLALQLLLLWKRLDKFGMKFLEEEIEIMCIAPSFHLDLDSLKKSILELSGTVSNDFGLSFAEFACLIRRDAANRVDRVDIQ